MQNTTHYNLKKPDYTDFADIQDINDNMDTIDGKLAAPDGDGRDQTVSFTDADLDSGITSFPTFLTKIVSGMKMAKFLRDFKAGMAYVLHVGDLINNATCTESGKALDARMGKTLQDQITSLNDSFAQKVINYYSDAMTAQINLGTIANNVCWRVGNVVYINYRTYGTARTISAGTAIAKLPEGYRPRSGIREVVGIAVANDNVNRIVTFGIDSNGNLTCGSSLTYTQIWPLGTITI